MFKSVSLLLMALFLTACATTSSDKLSVVKVAIKQVDQTPFVFVDARTAEQKTTRTEGTAYSTAIYLGDSGIEPPANELVKAWLNLKSTSLSGKRVELTEFEVRIVDPVPSVNQEQLQSSAAAVPGGLIVAPLAGFLIYGIEHMRREIITRAVIRITVNGREIEAISYVNYRNQVNEADLAATVQLGLDELVAKL